MSEPFSFEDFLAQQKAEYRSSLPGRLAALRDTWEAVQASDGSAATLTGLERVAHAIAGSAATFGLPAIGDAARALEDTLAPDAAQRPAWDADLSRQLGARVDGLAALLREEIGRQA